jgi:hypothetical protein
MAAVKATGVRGATALRDFLMLGGKAFVSGLFVALALGFAALVLASNARAAQRVPTDKEPWSVALTPAVSQAGVGALWANAYDASPGAPKQAATAADLELLLGLTALAAALVVAVIGRRCA